MNQSDFDDPADLIGDSAATITEFDLVDLGADDAGLPRRRVRRLGDRRRRRHARAARVAPRRRGRDRRRSRRHLPSSDPMGDTFYTGNGWVELSSAVRPPTGFARLQLVPERAVHLRRLRRAARPAQPDDGLATCGSMNYDELTAYDRRAQSAAVQRARR